jgi:hypothetical protein
LPYGHGNRVDGRASKDLVEKYASFFKTSINTILRLCYCFYRQSRQEANGIPYKHVIQAIGRRILNYVSVC